MLKHSKQGFLIYFFDTGSGISWQHRYLPVRQAGVTHLTAVRQACTAVQASATTTASRSINQNGYDLQFQGNRKKMAAKLGTY
jgi:hypothetical protein